MLARFASLFFKAAFSSTQQFVEHLSEVLLILSPFSSSLSIAGAQSLRKILFAMKTMIKSSRSVPNVCNPRSCKPGTDNKEAPDARHNIAAPQMKANCFN